LQEQVATLAAGMMKATQVGDPAEEGRHIGPVVNKTQWDKIQGLIAKGMEEGAKLETGGPGRPDGIETGYFVKPTLFSNVRNDMTIAREEIFGPVVTIIPYEDEEDAIRIANDTDYGLSAVVFGDTESVRASRRGCAPAWSMSMAASPIRTCPSAATSNRATAASTASSGWPSSSRSSRWSGCSPRARSHMRTPALAPLVAVRSQS
jgi:hypothetical protein